MVLSVENWLKLVSPADGSKFDTNEEFPVFAWDSSYIQFKIQFGKVEGQYTLTFPESGDAWLNEPSITLDRTQEADIKKQLLNTNEELQSLYWRVLAYDGTGNVEISKAQHIIYSK